MHRRSNGSFTFVAVALSAAVAAAQSNPRARDLGIPFDGRPGPLNAITDVEGVEVGHATIISGDGALEVGKGPVRTGVTVVLPRGRGAKNQVFAAWFTLNADGEMTGTTWIEESGILEGPVAITNTHSVGHQLKRIAKRASLGLGRNGSIAGNGSGDIFIAFTTAHPEIRTEERGLFDLRMLGNASLLRLA